MKTVRLDKATEAQLEMVAAMNDESVSAVIRHAIEEHCHRALGNRLSASLADVTGLVSSDGGRARKSGSAFVQQLKAHRKEKP